MRLIGIRVTPHKVLYSIVDDNEGSISTINQDLVIPVSFNVPQKLKYVRKTFLDILGEYAIVRAGIKLTEYSGYQGPDINRVMIEGVIQEMLASSKVEKYFTGTKVSIAARLGISADGTISRMIDGHENYPGIIDWQSLGKEHRECILTALAVNN
ncbi:hypothetical protein SAMN05216490_4724 [Mucilaginibacter mallensis]|jgi:hypothetical protein|uniref:Uncharacterized protein n=1 Tax=Mucilaginibacter mallensis TaxID=652787 RepID=A0A1H2C8U6_MUCMA|nr:hypothetical protein [Mucilaginibacter mallensis]SDT66692.1 hypothetical protein SAMN05216490_4724 [Mucilaginibacter mallensis]